MVIVLEKRIPYALFRLDDIHSRHSYMKVEDKCTIHIRYVVQDKILFMNVFGSDTWHHHLLW